MKTVQLSELKEQVLKAGKEALSIEHNGTLIGYFYPVNDPNEIKAAAIELNKAVEQVMAETGWDEERLVQALTQPE